MQVDPYAEKIGDGLYVTYDGFHVWVKHERPVGAIALTPSTFEMLVDYANRKFNGRS